jgi:RNA polymerase sigma-70 factor (ECF subfamily)
MERNPGLAAVKVFPASGTMDGTARSSAAAFPALVREHQSMVFSLACHFLRDPAVAEEIAQEAFLRLYQNLAAIESRQHMLRWLRKVTWRLCIDEIRRRPSHKAVRLDEAAELCAPNSESDPLSAEYLRRLVADLPESTRMAVILRYQEDMELAEIAEVLEVPINTVKSRLQRALVMLRHKVVRCSGGRGK